jgi:trans-aconitate methyltransferase
MPDGVLSLELARQVTHTHGLDNSPSMIQTSKNSASKDGLTTATFEVVDCATDLLPWSQLQGHQLSFSKAFSNAAMHWILRRASSHVPFFTGVRNCLAPKGTFAFEMGGLGNVSEMRAALLMAVGRRVGLEKAKEVDPWFFPDEDWVVDIMENKVGGWKVEKVEREWRPTTADAGGVEGWIRLMGRQFFEVLEDEEEKEKCIKEVVEVLEEVCAKPGDGWMFSYVRLRVLARKTGE